MSTARHFTGKVVLVTGSSSGIGATIAEEFAKAGAQVIITGRNATRLAEVGEKCLRVSPKALKPLEIVGDITKEENIQRLIDSTIEKFEQLDILVNNAGFGGASNIENPKILQVFDELMNVNVRSVIHLTHLSVQHLAKTKGNIINISSFIALKPVANAGVYCMTKCALDMFTKCTALELAPKGIRVNSINPAGVRTNIFAAMGYSKEAADNLLEQRGKSYPLGRVGEPLDVANIVLFLASDECSWITGSSFLADGGGLLQEIRN